MVEAVSWVVGLLGPACVPSVALAAGSQAGCGPQGSPGASPHFPLSWQQQRLALQAARHQMVKAPPIVFDL